VATGFERIEALAPDQASLDAARKLLKPASWPSLACDGGGLVWGEAQGSGAMPYRVVISETDGGYKCTCPSRKFPCKHALALMWLREEGKATFVAAEPPTWVQDWASRRRGPSIQAAPADKPKASIAASMAAETDVAEPDPKAEARAAAQRERNQQNREASILAGLDELDLWIGDQLDRGASAFVADALAACRKVAQRLVDAKAGGLAARLEGLPASLFSLAEPERPLAAIEELGLLHLMAEAYRRQHLLDPEMRADIRQTIGWSQSREALLADPQALRIAGRWHVFAANAVVQPDRLRRLETWLIREGEPGPPRYALLLDFVPLAGGATSAGFLLGDSFEAELVFHPSTAPLRALVGRQTSPAAGVPGPPPLPSQPLSEAHADYRAAVAARPWTGEWPLAFRSASVRRRGTDFFLVDPDDGLALRCAPEQAAALWSLAASPAVDGVGLWDGRSFRLSQAATDLGRWVDA
jgi:hypothetical protein